MRGSIRRIDGISLMLDGPQICKVAGGGWWILLFAGVLSLPEAVRADESADKREELHLYMKGRYLFQKNCTVCHGETGRGNGPWAAELKDKPRNFRTGVFKFRTTPFGKLPVDDDLRRTIRSGISGTAMPFFVDFSDEDVSSLIVYLQNLSRNWDDESLMAEPIQLPGLPEWYHKGEKAAAHAQSGKALFAIHCSSCHGPEGHGDGPASGELIDMWEHKIVPADLSAAHHKSGDKPQDLYRTIATGLNGTPMVGFFGTLDEESIWDLVTYIKSLEKIE